MLRADCGPGRTEPAVARRSLLPSGGNWAILLQPCGHGGALVVDLQRKMA